MTCDLLLLLVPFAIVSLHTYILALFQLFWKLQDDFSSFYLIFICYLIPFTVYLCLTSLNEYETPLKLALAFKVIHTCIFKAIWFPPLQLCSRSGPLTCLHFALINLCMYYVFIVSLFPTNKKDKWYSPLEACILGEMTFNGC